jgi:hypothetical protein
MYKRRNFMVDIETLGTTAGAAILSIGACEFDDERFSRESPSHFNPFYVNISLLSSLFEGLRAEPETINWWMHNSKESRLALLQEPQLTVRDGLVEFNRYLPTRNDDYHLWAKGPDFDLVMMAAVYDRLGMKFPWSFRNSRDVRTICWAGGVPPEVDTTLIQHNALHDAQVQADDVARNIRALKGKVNGEGVGK